MMIKSNVVIAAIMTLLMAGLVSSTTFVFAERPAPGYSNSGNCSWSGPNDKYQTCCWREKIKGSILGESFCQKCAWVEGEGYVNCTQKELQMLDTPPNPPPSSPSGPSAPIQDDGVLEQPDKPIKGSVMDLPNSNERTLE